MKKKYFKHLSIACSIFLGFSSLAQTNSNFESVLIDSSGYNDITGNIVLNTIEFSNDTSYASWNASGYYWSDGFAFSKILDDSTAGSVNEYGTYAGYALGDSGKFAIAQAGDYHTTYIKLTDSSKVAGFNITNSTYAALSMKNGDAFAKQFGDTTGGSDGKDWYKVTVSGFNKGVATSTVDYYLADFRYNDNSKDYIVKKWDWVDLRSLGYVDSLRFLLSSSDVGTFGMNTPAYFCLDNFTLLDTVVRSIVDTAICEGDSTLILGNLYSENGVWFDTTGVDSVSMYSLTINLSPNVEEFKLDSFVCQYSTIKLVGNGVFSGNGVSDSIFNTSNSLVTIGLNDITLTFTDSFGCTANYTKQTEVLICGGIEEMNKSQVLVYPTITSNELNIDMKEKYNFEVQIFNIEGDVMLQKRNVNHLFLNDLQTGFYFVHIVSEKGYFTQKIIKK